MKTAVIALTKGGTATALRISASVACDVYVKYPDQNSQSTVVFTEKLAALIAKIFNKYEAFVLVMATGIVFRTFAPYVKSKESDPALVVIDEKGTFAISLLSGHLGGANDLAKEIASSIGATPVITTATDVNAKIAFDNVAKKNGFCIENLEMLQHISGALVNGKKVALLTPYPIKGNIPTDITDYEAEPQKETVVISNRIVIIPQEHVLYLHPKNLVLGLGCRRNTPFQEIKEAFYAFMKNAGYSPFSLKAMSSIDLKEDEEGLISLSEYLQIPFLTFLSETLNTIAAEGGTSDFVKSVTGTASVCQSAALCGTKKGKTIVKKTIVNSITFSLAEEETIVYL